MPHSMPERAVRKQAELSVEIVSRVARETASGTPADHAMARLYRQHREFGSRDRRFFSDLVFSWFRWRGWLANPDQPREPDIVLAHQLDAVHVHPAIERLAASGTTDKLEALGGLALLEKARKAAVRRGLSGPLSPALLVPEWVQGCLHYPAPEERDAHFLRCIEAFQSRPPVWVRLRKKARERAATMASERFGQRAIPPLPGALRVEKAADLEELKRMFESDLEIQDLSSQCVGEICGPKPGEKWWDACAGSGGKALHLADLMGSGSILATDLRASILRECERRARCSGFRFVSCREWDGSDDPAPGSLFDGVLVDAPCSGLGTWHRNPDARWRTSSATVAERSAAQARLLNAAAEKVRAGGCLVYSICTMTRAETIGAVEAFLEARPDFTLERIAHPLTGEMTQGMVWIWPWQACSNGMFAARMQRRA